MQVHPKGTCARILLSSVFGPYAQDDEFGSRAINPMELYHNQVTRAQGAYSLRMFHRSWGIMMIQSNISAPCAVLDFPSLDDFVRELKANRYDIVGISSIIVNVAKVREMCRLVREHSPHSTLIVGGHVTAIPDIDNQLDADHFVKGEGISWMRRFLGEDPDAPIRHPEIVSGMKTRILGFQLPERKGGTAATIIPSVGCPLGCNFCTTSAFFGGKGKFINFYKTGDELFDVMRHMESTLGVTTFFMMDENFLLHRPRAIRLLELMREHNKSWGLAVFASANAIRKYTMLELVELGVSWVWMGLESPQASLCQTARHGHATTHSRTPRARHSRARFDHHRIGTPHTREHPRRDRTRRQPQHRLPPVHALHPGAGNASLSTDFRGRPSRRDRGPCRHSRTAQVQLPSRGDFARRLQNLSRSGIPARLRAQWTEPLPHVPYHAARLEALQELSRPSRSQTLRARNHQAIHRLRGRALGHGKRIPQGQR